MPYWYDYLAMMLIGMALITLGALTGSYSTVWLVILIVSPIWLRHFRFGPLEWLWRSLTYWKKQPFRLDNASPSTQ
jgi:uncharacterized membrane protein YeiB